MIPRSLLRLGFALVFGALAGGCFGGSSSKTAAIPSPDANAELGIATGTIEGQVVDEEVLPVEGAAVGLADNRDVRTTTDATGVFILSKVSAGAHQLLVQKDGYKHGTLELTVIDGETFRARIVLKAISRIVPREVTFIYNGYLGFDLAIPSGNQFGPGPAGDVKRSVYYAVEQPDLVSVYAAAQWTGNLPTVSNRMYLLIYLNLDKSLACDDAARVYCLPMAWAEGPSPLSNGSSDYQEHMRERSDLRLNVRFKMRPCVTSDVGPGWVNPDRCPNPADLVKLALDQKVNAYTTVFYGQAAPPGYSPLPK